MPQKLGQHFLKNKSVLERIVQSLEIKEGDVVVEIGPGHGELTEELKTSSFAKATADRQNSKLKIIAIELDKDLARFLKDKFLGDKYIEIIEGNALKILPTLDTSYKLRATSYKLIGNIPYYITGHLLRIIGELKNKPTKTILLIQKEVAQRICAKPPHSSLLSLSVQFWAEPRILEFVSKKHFLPPPEVESAVIELNLKKSAPLTNQEKYYSFVKAAFKQPRKLLVNNLVAGGLDKNVVVSRLAETGIDLQARPALLDVESASRLAQNLL
jgi:16S rRNA (adenine1518-N6/adenine1519-N6)-dimethyltransferase